MSHLLFPLISIPDRKGPHNFCINNSPICLENCLVITISNSNYTKIIENTIEEFIELDIGEIHHIGETFSVPNSELTTIVRTGIVKKQEFWEPYSFWKFFYKETLIGKAVIQFHALEMNDCAPTVNDV